METSSIHSSLELFAEPYRDVGIESVRTLQVLPTSGVTNDSSLEIFIPGESSRYIDLNNTRLYIRVKVVKSDGSDVTDTIKLIDLWPHALFKQVDLYMADKCVSSSTNTYPYRSFLETCLSYSKEVKNDLLKGTEHWGGASVTAGKNELEAIVPLHLDMAHQGKLVPNNMPMRLRFLRNLDEFCIIKGETDTNTYQIQIQKMYLLLRTIAPTPAILLNHASQLARQNIVYSLDRVWLKTFNLTTGISDTVLSNIYLGPLPNRLIVGLVETAAFIGNDKKNPFKFEHFNVQEISLISNGQQIPSVPYECDFDANICRREYMGLLYTLLGDDMKQDSIGLSFDEFKDGKTFFGFTLPSVMDGARESAGPRQNGYINLRIRFKKALAKNITVIVYGEFDNTLEIDATRNVYTDFGA